MNYELIEAKRRQNRINKIMRLPVPYKVRLEAVQLFGMKEGKSW